LADDGWFVFANVFGPGWYYNYGPFPAPNSGAAFSAVETGQGGPAQGLQQLSVFSDYNNGNHYDGTGAVIESNVFQEQLITAADIGTMWRFKFDARRANIAGESTAAAFFKTIIVQPCCSLSNYIPLDTTNVPDTWDTYSISIYIDPSLEGQLLQFGFLNNASNGEDSGIFYDNIGFGLAPVGLNLDIKPGSDPNSINPFDRGSIPVAILGSQDFDVSTIDATTLVFGPNQVATRHDLGDDWTFNEHMADVNLDGFMDLMTHFKTRDTGIACGDTEATLSGTTLDGASVEGSDAIRTVGCNSNRPLPTLRRGETNRIQRPKAIEEHRVD
jgi:hypothetical protein